MWRGLALVAPALVAVASAAGPAAGPAPRVRACVTLSETWNGARSNHLPTSLFVEFARLPPASPHFQWAGAQAKGCRTRNGSHVNFHVVHGGALVSAGGTAARAPRGWLERKFGGGSADVLIVFDEGCAREERWYELPMATVYRAPRDVGSAALWLPLARTHEFARIDRAWRHGGETKPAAAVGSGAFEYLFNMICSLGTNPTWRLRWATEAEAFRAKLEESRKFKAFIRNAKSWGRGVHVNASGHLDEAALHGVMRASAFTVAPPGHNWEAFRIWEAMSVASIPIVAKGHAPKGNVKRGKSHCGTVSEAPFATAPFIWVRESLEEAWPEVLSLAANATALAERREAVRLWGNAALVTARTRLEALAAAALARANDARAANETAPGPLVVGAAKSGLASVARLLAANGAAAAPALTASWRAAADVDESSGAPSVHVVRDPLDHVSELARSIDAAVYSFAGRFCPRVAAAHAAVEAGVPSGDGNALRLALAATYYLDWNALAARAAPHARLRLEDFDEYALFAALGVERRTTWPLRRTWASLEAERAAADGARLSWGDVRAAIGDALCDELEAAAASYGYRQTDANNE